jgi:hypothetical protein
MREALVLIGSIALAATVPLPAGKLPPVRSEQTDAQLKLEVSDLTPRFLALYEAARGAPDAVACYALWTR